MSYQNGKTVHVHAKHYRGNKDERTPLGVCGDGSVPLGHLGNVVTRIGIHTHTRVHSNLHETVRTRVPEEKDIFYLLYHIYPAIRRVFFPSRMTSNN